MRILSILVQGEAKTSGPSLFEYSGIPLNDILGIYQAITGIKDYYPPNEMFLRKLGYSA